MIWKTVTCTGHQNGAPTNRGSLTMRAGLCTVTFILGVVLVLAAGTLPALADVQLFQTAVSYDTGTNPYGVAVGDFNGDGQPDLAVTNSDYNKVSVLLINSPVLTSLDLTGTITDLTAGGSVYVVDGQVIRGHVAAVAGDDVERTGGYGRHLEGAGVYAAGVGPHLVEE